LIIYRLPSFVLLNYKMPLIHYLFLFLSYYPESAKLGLPFPGSIKPKLLLESCQKSFLMAKKKGNKRATQVSSSSENREDTVTQNMADRTISGDLPFRPRTASGSQNPLQPPHRRRPKRNIVAEFERYFGEVSKLENWQRLCADVGIEDDLPSLTQCKKVCFFFGS
jgi:hypothetical protein